MRWPIVSLVVLVLLAGCQSPFDDSRPAPVLRDPVTVATTVSTIRAGQGDALVLTVQVPAGSEGCASRPEVQVVGYDRTTLRVRTVVQSDRARSCTRTASRTFTAQVPRQGRGLVVNDVAWGPTTSGTALVQCDATVGCDPPEDRCDPVWTSSVTPHFDLPPQKETTVAYCSAPWLVLNVRARARSGATQRLRWFARLDADRNWQVVGTAMSRSVASCRVVRRQLTDLPASVCTALARS